MDWMKDFADWAEARHWTYQREDLINDVAKFIYPRPIWAGGMDDMPQPKTAQGYATRIVDMIHDR